MRTSLRRSSRLSVAIVGAGLTGRWHAAYCARSGGNVVAIVDPDLSRAQRLADRVPRASVFSSLSECFARSEVDAVHVCTPTSTHVSCIEEALEAGVHVLAEKPLALGAADTARLLENAAEKGLVLTAVHQFPFQRGARRLDAHRKALGRLIRLDFVLCSAGGENLPGARRREALLAVLPHPLSLFRFFLDGLPKADDWLAGRHEADEIELTSRYREVGLGIRLSWLPRPIRCELTALGTEGTASLDLFHGFCVTERGKSASRPSKAIAPFRFAGSLLWAAFANLTRRGLAREPAYPGLAELIRRFYDSIRSGCRPPVGPEEILAVALLIDRLREKTED